jgi:hypothetical protein
MSAIALLRGKALVGRDVPSLFGGRRWAVSARSTALLVRPDGGFAPSDESPGALTVDLAHIIEREAQSGPPPVEVKGANPAAGFLAVTRDGGRNVSPGDSLGTAQDACQALAAWLRDAAGELEPEAAAEVVRPARWARTETGRALDRALESVGFEIRDLEARIAPSAPALFVDDLSVYATTPDARSMRLSAHGQAASLAFGLAPHVARRMVELAGAERVWTEGYSAFARAIAVQAVERALLKGIPREAPFAVGGEPVAVFPALPDAAGMLDPAVAVELDRLRAAGESNERLERLLQMLEQKRAALVETARRLWSLEVLAGLPRLDDLEHWFEKQDELIAFVDGERDGPLPWVGGLWKSALGRFLARRGRTMTSLPPRWFAPPSEAATKPQAASTLAPEEVLAPIEPEEAPPSEAATKPEASSTIPPTLEPAPVEPAPEPEPVPEPAPERTPGELTLGVLAANRAHDPRVLQLSIAPNLATLEIVVEGEPVDDAASEVEPLFSRGGAVLRLRPKDIRTGDVICVKYLRAEVDG